jgi:type IV pilus assembly protein PilX
MIGRRHLRLQAGMVLITTLLLLIVVTLLAVGMFRSFGLDEKIAGNMREKQRALTAAETAEQYAEWWLSNGNGYGPGNTTCTTPLALSALAVCSNVMTTPTQLPWTVGTVYQPSVTTPMPLSATGGQNTYYNAPIFYISYLGPAQGPNGGYVYQIDAVGYAGSPDTAAVVESTYVIQNQSGSPTTPAPGGA